MADTTFIFTCEKGHVTELSVDEAQEYLEYQTCPVDECGAAIESIDPDEIEVECVECGWAEQCSWEDAMTWLWADCPRCRANAEESGDIRIVGTLGHGVRVYHNFCEPADVKPFLRDERPDYWELVVHYTSRANFMSIMELRCVSANPTGYFKVPSVCLTEVPAKFNSEFKSRFGPFGIAFRKKDIISAGGGPAVYLLDSVIQAQIASGDFCGDLKPFINVLRIPATAPTYARRKKVDYIHEREWRFPGDLDFSNVKPVGVILQVPDVEKFSGPDGKRLLEIAWNYKEIL